MLAVVVGFAVALPAFGAARDLSAGALAKADAKEDVKNAAKKLDEAASYSWTSTPKSEGAAAAAGKGGRFTPGPTEGKTEKDGFTTLVTKAGETSIEAALKGGKSAVKTAEGWKSSDELSGAGKGGQRDPAAFFARRLRDYKLPGAQAADLADKAKELKAEGDAISGELTEDGAKALMSFGGGGGQAPTIAGAKGTVKFWIKDGALVKFEYNVQGKMTFGTREIDRNTTTTVEIKDVGSTKVEVAEDAKKKLG
jgi:hypothetical protein